MIKIIDVSKYQGEIDWLAVKDSGVVGAFIRAVDDDGVSPDPTFERNWRMSKEAGLMRGFYSINYAWLPPVETAQKAVKIVRERSDGDWWMGEWRPALDVEPDKPYPHHAAHVRLQLQTLEAETGKQPIIYTSAQCWNRVDPNNEHTWASNYALWIANYWYPATHSTTWEMFNTLPPTMPLLPAAWKKYTLWQWAGNDGVQEGIATKCDLNVLNGDLDGVHVNTILGSPPLERPRTLSERFMKLKDKLFQMWEERGGDR